MLLVVRVVIVVVNSFIFILIFFLLIDWEILIVFMDDVDILCLIVLCVSVD